MPDENRAAIAIILLVAGTVGCALGFVYCGDSRREHVADSVACARMCYPTRVLQCGPVRDESWPQPKRLAICLAPEGVRAVTE